MAGAACIASSPASIASAIGASVQRVVQQERSHGRVRGRIGPGVAASGWAGSKTAFLHTRQCPMGGTAGKMPGAANARRSAARAALAERQPATAEAAHQLPAASDAPLGLDVDTLQLALHSALLSALAYKSPVQVEYLRLRANGKSQEQALKVIEEQAGTTPAELGDPAKLEQLEKENKERGFTDILTQFDEPSQYFDGKQSLFMKATVAYVFFCPTPKGQRNVLYCVFRGTEGLEDMVADLQLAQVQIAPEPPAGNPNLIGDIKKIMLHRGFRDQYVAVATALTRNVEAAARAVLHSGDSVASGPARLTDLFKAKVAKEAANDIDGFEVVVTGHSLGAALATIGSFVAALEHPHVRVHYFGFGSPRVGNRAFVEAFRRVISGHAVHFANRNDIVTGIPIPPLYMHVLGGHMLDQAGSKVTASALQDETGGLSSTAQWFANSLQFVGWFRKQKDTVLWSQHDMGLYIARVRALLQQAKAGK
ncbi:hypothetical protein KFL_006500050 [Klebsormidium nitens]|uniref:Fungal lipase-type domain-containing protein n=1 Tax=Klebsormidium nitens TaxID=105231 RepID=A0A1Y1IMX6_KLENI|nr:hypothetical protein KFL_006500050 [Klebsormidium nitens]|eukprot:GAQ90511.1 hypothetical protein KFL_006500050 [Klebsormidium nitens]